MESGYVNGSKDEIKNYLSKKCTIINASAVVFENTKNITQCLSKLKDFKSCGDWLFWLMYLHNSKRITYSTSTTNYFWSHPNTTRWVIPFSRNFEVLKIYKWVCQNILNNKESLSLITYYFSTHLNFHSRKNILKNICFISQSFKYTVFTSWFLLKYYLREGVYSKFLK